MDLFSFPDESPVPSINERERDNPPPKGLKRTPKHSNCLGRVGQSSFVAFDGRKGGQAIKFDVLKRFLRNFEMPTKGIDELKSAECTKRKTRAIVHVCREFDEKKLAIAFVPLLKARRIVVIAAAEGEQAPLPDLVSVFDTVMKFSKAPRKPRRERRQRAHRPEVRRVRRAA